MSAEQKSSQLPPALQLIQMGMGFMQTKLVYVAARLNLGEKLAAGPRNSGELAKELSVHAPYLYRFMRALAGHGILTEVEEGTFALTSLGEALRPDHPGVAYATLLSMDHESVITAWERLPQALETGGIGFDIAYDAPFFDYLSERPELSALFNQAMVGFFGKEPLDVAAAYDFSSFQSVVDVGGGNGNVLTHIFSQHDGPRGVVFDLPHVVVEASALIQEKHLAHRITAQAGDFFETVPEGHDVYLLSHIIHDWEQSKALAILENCRKAVKPDGRLLILEWVLPEGDTPHIGKILDIHMMALVGGEERTAKQYRELLKQAGFCMTRVVPTVSNVSIIEAVPN